MYVYVAGASGDREMLRKVMDRLEAGGVTITHDWTTCEARDMTIADAAECARKDINGVVNADVLLAFLTRDEYAYRGTRHEIGAMLAMKAQGNGGEVWIVNSAGDPHEIGRDALPPSMQCCFEYMADRFFNDTEVAMKELLHQAQGVGVTPSPDIEHYGDPYPEPPDSPNPDSPKPLGVW